jgi:hypothetical protein
VYGSSHWLDLKELKNLTLPFILGQDLKGIEPNDLQQEMQEASGLSMDLQNQATSVSAFKYQIVQLLG